MKIITPPQINGLDELLDVIIHPEKMVKTLQALKDMRDQVTASLGLYTTKERAEEYLSLAQSAKDQAEATVKESVAVREKAQAFADEMKKDFQASQAIYKSKDAAQAQKAKDLTFLEKSLDERGKALATRSDELDARESAVQDATAALMRRQAALDAEVDKMKQRIALFSDLH